MPKFEPTQDPVTYIVKASVRLLFLVINFFAVYLTLKGHNAPGGGFIGGLASALSLILINMVMGIEEVKRIVRLDPVRIAVSGLVLSYSASFLPVLCGLSFLQHNVELHVPGSAHLHVNTALFFDLGVFLVVVGVVSKLMLMFSSSVQIRPAFLTEEVRYYSSPFEEPIENAAEADEAPGRRPGKYERLRRHRRQKG